VEGQAQGVGHVGEFDHPGVEIGHQSVGAVGGQRLGQLLDAETADVHDRTEAVQEVGHLDHLGYRGVDQPQQVAHARGRLGQLHDGHAAWSVSHGDEWSRRI
jgi:hypothetical protein